MGQAGKDGDQNLPLGIQGVDVFLLEHHGDSEGFKLSDRIQAIDRVAGETGNTFCVDNVNLPCLTIGNHTIEALAVFKARARYTFIGIQACHAQMGIFVDHGGVVAALCFITGFLVGGICRNAAVTRGTEDWKRSISITGECRGCFCSDYLDGHFLSRSFLSLPFRLQFFFPQEVAGFPSAL